MLLSAFPRSRGVRDGTLILGKGGLAREQMPSGAVAQGREGSPHDWRYMCQKLMVFPGLGLLV